MKSVLLQAALCMASIVGFSGSPIKHLIVVVMENRSFDSLLGGFKLAEMGISATNPSPNGTMITAEPTVQMISHFNPGHEIPDVTEQIYGAIKPENYSNPTMSGFAINAARVAKTVRVNPEYAMHEVMDYYPDGSLPILQTLAKHYTVIDRWFSSVPGPTFPNRHFIHCATAQGNQKNSFPLLGFPMKTIYDSMNQNNRTWRYYFSGRGPFLILYKNLRSPRNLRNFRTFSHFVQDAKSGSLPDYTFIDPDFEKSDEHPPHSFLNGEEFLKSIYNAVRTSPVWNETALLITFDEHGGFYDHVTPPVNVPIPDSNSAKGGFRFDRLGVRVPAIMVSPWVKKGGVISHGADGRIFEHSSIAATLKKLFGLDNFLTQRDAWAASFENVFNQALRREDCLLPFE